MSIKLKPIDSTDYEYLYKLLKERTPDISISHREMPTFDQHARFWMLRPYKEAYIIYESMPVGMAYLTDRNEVGIFIESTYQGQGIGQAALKLVLSKHKGERILANINPHNKKSIDFFAQMGFKHIENTYELILLDTKQ